MSGSLPKYRVNDVVALRVRQEKTDKEIVTVIDPADVTFENMQGVKDFVHHFRIIGIHANDTSVTYIVDFDEDLLSLDVRVTIDRLTLAGCKRLNIDTKFEDHIAVAVPQTMVLEKNSLKTYELYQKLDLEEGATCRGPCKVHNKYAVSDSMDGTYWCSSCRFEYDQSTPITQKTAVQGEPQLEW